MCAGWCGGGERELYMSVGLLPVGFRVCQDRELSHLNSSPPALPISHPPAHSSFLPPYIFPSLNITGCRSTVSASSSMEGIIVAEKRQRCTSAEEHAARISSTCRLWQASRRHTQSASNQSIWQLMKERAGRTLDKGEG